MTLEYFNIFSFYILAKSLIRQKLPVISSNFIIWQTDSEHEAGFHLPWLKGMLIICSILYRFICFVFSVWEVEMKLVLYVYYFSGSIRAVC